MVTKLGGMRNYYDGLMSIKAQDTWVMWPCEISPINVSPIPQCLWPPNLVEW